MRFHYNSIVDLSFGGRKMNKNISIVNFYHLFFIKSLLQLNHLQITFHRVFRSNRKFRCGWVKLQTMRNEINSGKWSFIGDCRRQVVMTSIAEKLRVVCR